MIEQQPDNREGGSKILSATTFPMPLSLLSTINLTFPPHVKLELARALNVDYFQLTFKTDLHGQETAEWFLFWYEKLRRAGLPTFKSLTPELEPVIVADDGTIFVQNQEYYFSKNKKASVIAPNENPNLPHYIKFKEGFNSLDTAQKMIFISDISSQLTSLSQQATKHKIQIEQDSIFYIADFESEKYAVIIGDYGMLRHVPSALDVLKYGKTNIFPKIYYDSYDQLLTHKDLYNDRVLGACVRELIEVLSTEQNYEPLP